MNDQDTAEASPFSRKESRVIAIDFDDVMWQCADESNRLLAKLFGVHLTLEDRESIKLFQCRGWGTPAEVGRKQQALGKHGRELRPTHGLVPAIKRLRILGFELHIVTGTILPERQVPDWLSSLGLSFGPGSDIEAIHFTTGSDRSNMDKKFLPVVDEAEKAVVYVEESDEEENRRAIENMAKSTKENTMAIRKLNVLEAIGACILIDDQHQNFYPIIDQGKDIECLLFGDYKWNQNDIDFQHPHDYLTWSERKEAGVSLALRPLRIEGNKHLHRVRDWSEVIQWIESNML